MLRALAARYEDLQQYVAWTAEDIQRITAAGSLIEPHFIPLVEDFYAELQRHPETLKVITGGAAQIERLKKTLIRWLAELFAGQYDADYLARRWKVGQRHVEIGLPQFFTVAALSRLRNGMLCVLADSWRGSQGELIDSIQSLNRLLDLDLAVIGDAYEVEYVKQKQDAERCLLDDALHREKELSTGLLTHAQAAVIILDRTGRIVRCNPFVEALAVACFGGPALDLDWFEFFLAKEDRERARQILLFEQEGGAPRQLRATSTLNDDGRRRQLHWAGASLHDAAGKSFAVLMIGHEVTDLIDAQHRALQAERLAAIGQMATGLAHESRNALQRIGASAEMLELEVAGNRKALELVARIEQSKDHLHHLLEEVRSYAAPIVLDRSPLRITEAWREAWELLFPQRRGRDVTLHEDICEVPVLVQADRFRLVQVFRNLLDNALAAAADPVRINISCEHSWLNGNPAVLVRVRDNGPGMTAEQRRRIFEPFFTTKPTGTGLGTAIAQRLVEAHGGTIAVGESNGEGTEIQVTLPAAEAHTPSFRSVKIGYRAT